jgi:TrmH family RNA methyltransferase
LKIHTLKSQVFKKLADTESPQGILMIMNKPTPEKNEDSDISEERMVLILDGIRDPGNLGTIVRAAAWFGVYTIILSQDSVDAYNLKVVRSSMGSIFRMNFIQSQDLKETIGILKENNFIVVGAFPQATLKLEEHIPEFPLALIMRAEASGISPALLSLIDIEITIHKSGDAESLNVAVAAGILMNHYSRFF